MGVIVLVISQFLGWGGIALLCSLVFKTSKPATYFFGVGVYTVSWGLFGGGVILAGPEGIHIVRNLLKKYSIFLPLRFKGAKKDGTP
jgi:hypothetical protein